MRKRIGRLVYGDRSYYILHIIIGAIVMACIGAAIHFVFNQPVSVVLKLISDSTVGLSASLLGFQLAGVSILISLGGNKKLLLLREIGSENMIYKVFISSISMFLFSIILMLISLNLFTAISEPTVLQVRAELIIDYCSVVTFFFGMTFLFSSIQLLKWCYSK